MELLIKNSRIIDSSQDFVGDVYINNGKIEELGINISKNCKVINGEGLVLLPSFMDLHSHFREPGLTNKEDILSGCLAAVKGGYTGVNLMANTKPVCSSTKIVEYVLEKSKNIGLVDIIQTVSITRDMNGIEIDHLDEINNSVRFISDDGKGVLKSKVMLDAMIKAKEKGITVISHAEDEEITPFSTRLSENVITSRDICLAKFTGCHLHMAHVSTKEAMKEIIEAKKMGYNVTCEVTPHHLALTGEMQYRVNPPLRNIEDIRFLIDAIKNNYVDAIATDHAPHTTEDKINGAPGISGIETSFQVCYTKLVREGHITINKLSELMSRNPARLMGYNKGEIKIGYDGDVVLVDLNYKERIVAERFVSKGKNTPFEGMEFYGGIMKTIKGGRIVYSREDLK
ncbi:dihydroorotase [Fervidicella metallireducens AeB]|uniref:Dihydroorotase n=1 Tax=Fervidicella metallireducens AeB TaxID=1403537 RepID=A0A017RU72_9CLOT|nr:dihydroorotase [Fervidicella metallireducens]EYE87969.1 dihydroorotase [Fervidicella metallireducens AeB]